MSDNAASPPLPADFRLDDAIAKMKHALRAHRHAKLDWLVKMPGHAALVEAFLDNPPDIPLRYDDHNFQPFLRLRFGMQGDGLTTVALDALWRRYVTEMDALKAEDVSTAPFMDKAKVQKHHKKIMDKQHEFAKELRQCGEKVWQYAQGGTDPKHHIGKGDDILRILEDREQNLLERDYNRSIMRLASQILARGRWKIASEGKKQVERWEMAGTARIDSNSELFGAMSQIVAACRFAALGGLDLTVDDFALGPPQPYKPVLPPHAPEDKDEVKAATHAPHDQQQAYTHERQLGSGEEGFKSADFEVRRTGEKSPAPPPPVGSDNLTLDAPTIEPLPLNKQDKEEPDAFMIRRPLSDRCIDYQVLHPLAVDFWSPPLDKHDNDTVMHLRNETDTPLGDIRAAIERTWPHYVSAGRSPG